jgi:hypothetical protein
MRAWARSATAALVLAATASLLAQTPPVRLGEVLAGAGVPSDGLATADLAAPVADYAVEQRPEQSSVVYHAGPPGEARVMHVLVRDHGQRAWRSAAIPSNPGGDGELAQVRFDRTRLVVETQAGAHTGRVLVLDRDLTVTKRFDGLLLAMLPRGALLLREHSPTRAHPVLVGVYTPQTDSLTRIYPQPPWSEARQQFIERAGRAYARWGLRNCIAAGHSCNTEQFDASIVSEVRLNDAGTRLAWITRFDSREDGAAPPVDANAHVVVACREDDQTRQWTCRERPFVNYDGPEGKKTSAALLAAVLRSRF